MSSQKPIWCHKSHFYWICPGMYKFCILWRSNQKCLQGNVWFKNLWLCCGDDDDDDGDDELSRFMSESGEGVRV